MRPSILSSARTTPVTLRTNKIEVSIIPQEGGRIASLHSLQTGLEFLTQARPRRPTIAPDLEASFQHGPCAGAEECLPTVGSCPDCTDGPVPDHGDFWQIPWQTDSLSDSRLEMHAVGFSRPFRFERVIEVSEASVSLNYKVINIGSKPLSFLYAWHPLFAVDAGDRVVLPSEVSDVSLFYSRDEVLENAGRNLQWPTLENKKGRRDLSVGMAAHHGTAEMIYTRKLQVGRCGLFRRNNGQGVILSFDTSRLPYLGVWLCFGGWPLSGMEPKQVAIALEPTTAPFNKLSVAEQIGLAPSLAPECSFVWHTKIVLTAPGTTYRRFVAEVAG